MALALVNLVSAGTFTTNICLECWLLCLTASAIAEDTHTEVSWCVCARVAGATCVSCDHAGLSLRVTRFGCAVLLAGACEVMLRSTVGPPPPHARHSLFDSCHRKIRLIGGGPVAFLGGLVA
ncbi:unnamed protein product [Leptidea sinapis]|uniref:Secreted protein n=1 Tax=Leptidea sinapis TaxID=189913 RepID=A0A5E4QW41_9NEOP|nr:unnamed protein product [Leptidea sinapis]